MGTTIQPADLEYVPVVATGCWVNMEHVSEGDGIWLVIGGQTMGLAKAGKADDDGWRPVWWFTNEVELPLCMCVYMPLGVCPSMEDGTHDYARRLDVKWQCHAPSEEMMSVLSKINDFEKSRTPGDSEPYSGPECLSVPVQYPGSDEENTIEFHHGMAGLSRYIERDDFIKRFNNMSEV